MSISVLTAIQFNKIWNFTADQKSVTVLVQIYYSGIYLSSVKHQVMTSISLYSVSPSHPRRGQVGTALTDHAWRSVGQQRDDHTNVGESDSSCPIKISSLAINI